MSKKTNSQNKTSKLAKTGSETFSWSITLTIATIIFILLIGGAYSSSYSCRNKCQNSSCQNKCPTIIDSFNRGLANL